MLQQTASASCRDAAAALCTRDTRRIPDNCSGVSGWVSGSDSAAVTTSSSVMASSRPQSVSPRGLMSPGFTVTRVVPVLLMLRGLSGRYYSAAIFITQCNDYEQNAAASASDDLNSLLAILEPRVNFFQPVRIFEAAIASRKSTSCLRRFSVAVPLSHSYCTPPTVPDTGSSCKYPRRLHQVIWRGLRRNRSQSATVWCSGVKWRARRDSNS